MLRSFWLFGVGVLSLGLAFGYWRLARLCVQTQRIQEGVLFDSVSAASAAFDLRPPILRVGRSVVTPFVAGVLRPSLFLPKGWAEEQQPSTLDAILRHEMAHIAGRDLQWCLFNRVITILLWPQPLLWVMKRPASRASEEVCDQKVLSMGYSAERYATSLLDLRGSLLATKARVPVGIGAVAIRSGFGHRIEAIMNSTEALRKELSPKAMAGWASLAAVTAIAGVVLFAAPRWRDSAAFGNMGQHPATGRISVRILTPDGKPASGWAAISFSGKPAEDDVIPVPVHDGRVDVDLSIHPNAFRAVLVGKSPDSGIGFVRVWPVEKPVRELRLAPATVLAGQLIQPDGKPAAGVPIQARIIAHPDPLSAPFHQALLVSGELKPMLSTKTDSNGRFQISNLAQGAEVHFELNDPRFAVTEQALSGKALASQPKSTWPPIRLHFAAAVEGRVTRNGKPVAGLHIGAQGSFLNKIPVSIWGDAVTDAEGRYHLGRLVGGIYNVIADLPRSLASEVAAVAHEGIEVSEGQTKTGVDFELVPGGFVTGKVAGPDGSPLAGILVGIYGPAHPISSAWVQNDETGPDGTFRLRVPAGRQFIYLQNADDPDTGRTISIRDGETIRADFLVK